MYSLGETVACDESAEPCFFAERAVEVGQAEEQSSLFFTQLLPQMIFRRFDLLRYCR